MKIVNLDTREEWLNWRLQGIGGSDAPVVMQASAWSTPFKLWQEKTRRVPGQETNAAMQRGLDLEPIARKRYEDAVGMAMPAANVENDKMPFIRVSLDGVNGRRGLEIKCPGKADHAMAASGQIPEKYLWQLRHQMLAADLDVVDYFSFDGENGVIVPFHRDEKTEKILLSTEIEFWEFVQTDTAPELTDKDYRENTDPSLIALCDEFKARKLLLDAEEEKQKALKAVISKHCSGDPLLCAGVAIQPITRKGNVQYAKIPELAGVNLDKYRAKPTTYVDIRIKRGAK